jgi:hypothetical protein
MRAAARRMRATRSGTSAATSELHGAAAASVGAVGPSADPRALLRGMAAAGAAGDFLSPRRLLAAVQAREGGGGGGGGGGVSSKRAARGGTPK